MNNLLTEIQFNIIKYNPIKFLKYYFNKTNLKLSNHLLNRLKSLYYFLYKEKSINSPYTYPKKHTNEYINAVINRNSKRKIYKNFQILKNGKLIAKGHNISGELGLGLPDNTHVKQFLIVPGVSNVFQVFSHGMRNILLLKTGEIMACGFNYKGQLGFGVLEDRNKFEYIKNSSGENINNVAYVFFGEDSVFLLLQTGQVMACGSNESGEMGLGVTKTTNRFQPIPEITNIKKIVPNFYFTFLLLNNGQIMASGANDFGQLGFSDQTYRFKFELVKDEVGKNINNVKKIYCFESFVILVLENGTAMYSGDCPTASQYTHKFTPICGVQNVSQVFYEPKKRIIFKLKNGKKIKHDVLK